MKIALGTFKDNGEALSAFLEARVGTKAELSGDSIEIDSESVRKGMNTRKVKTYVKRFLFMKGVRKDYRVFVDADQLTIQELETTESEDEEEKEKKLKEKEKIAAAERDEKEERDASDEKDKEKVERERLEKIKKTEKKKAAPKKEKAPAKKAKAKPAKKKPAAKKKEESES